MNNTKRIILCLLAGLAAVLAAVSQAAADPARKFNRGEKMTYTIEYAGITAGYSYLRVDSELTYAGQRSAYHIVNETWSNPFFSKFYQVHDRFEAFTDYEHLYSLRYQKKMREGGYRHEESLDFDQEQNKVTYNNGQVIATTPQARDILTSLYYARTFSLESGKSLYIDNHTDKNNYPLEVKLLRKEKIKTIFGKVECLVVEPVLRYPGLFQNKGRLLVWLTNDSRRIPVLMKSKILVGSINAVLKEYNQGIDGPDYLVTEKQ